ncbi:YqaE/Pmp3 family membrane protein [Sungkyunkwania multivorans]|uniref:YqaE/Pmp3 family membrane protein n=1 Tax=Sungkyunkwania multivorans TaxID=1173618 RepID=A0ABW3D130_9FLAO
MSLLTIILNILLPPLAVFLKHGIGTAFLVSILLTLIGWLPGVIHAFIVNQ